MPRLVIHPGTPQAWEIQLKPGLNFLGRGASNDFKIEDLSISGSHCQIVVDQGSTMIKDMGSTNGTFVNRSRVQESRLESGQPLRLGSVDMIFYTDGPDAVQVNTVLPPPLAPQAAPPPPPPAPKPAPSLRISGLAPAAPPSAVATVTDASPLPAAFDSPHIREMTGTYYCKFHPKVPARFFCGRCNRAYCDLCVTSRNVGAAVVKTCRGCGSECVPVHFQRAATKNFYAGLASAFVYPFKGAGIIILVGAAIAFAVTGLVGYGLGGLTIKTSIYGLIFLFMQNIIHTTTSDEDEPLSFPEPNGLAGAAFQLLGTILASFWLPIVLAIAKFCEAPIPVEAIFASVILGFIYFPMAFLAVAMKDTVAAANPLIVIPAIMKVPGQYAITVVLLLIVFGIRQLGSMLSSSAGSQIMVTKDMSMLFMAIGAKALLGLVGVYLLTVTMRILGLFYNASKDKLGWFSH
jgi:hypothetical protein